MFNRHNEKITAEFMVTIGPNRPIYAASIPVYDYTADGFANRLKFINEQVQLEYENRIGQDLFIGITMGAQKFYFNNIHTWNLFYEEVSDYLYGKITFSQLSNNHIQFFNFYNSHNIKNLDVAITKLYALGEKISKTDQSKGDDALQLAQQLRCNTENFLRNYHNAPPTSKQLAEFKESFAIDLHSKDREMSVHRKLWTPVIANIAIALTAVGLIAIAVKLIHSKLTTGQFSLFNYKTSRQSAVEKIEKEAAKCGLMVHSKL